MHQNNQDRNPHKEKPATRRAEIIIRFDVVDNEASQNHLDAIVGTLKKELRGYEEFANRIAEVEGKWI